MNAPHNLLLEALADFTDSTVLGQLALILAALALGWGLAHLSTRRLPPPDPTRPALHGLRHTLAPLAALLLLLLGKAVVKKWLSLSLVDVAIPLLLALTLLRLASQSLRYVFRDSPLLSLVQRAVTGLVLLALLLHLTGLHRDVLDTLEEIGFTIGRRHVSLLLVLQGLVSVVVTLLVALALAGMLENRIARTPGLDPSLRLVLAKTMRAVLVLLAVVLALPLAGIDITFLSVFGGALGVGLGFGLQKIAANYVSGFIILLDRSVRIGDLLTVGDRFGEVTQITTRYTVLRSIDGTEAIIPNETLISSVVVNHSFTSREVRLKLPVQIAYESDVDRALACLVDIARSHPRVLAEPPPNVLLREFADSGIVLDLVVWIRDPEEGQATLRSALNLEILRRFRAEGIEIPYPRRDIRVLKQ